ncbi:hypothetical protein EC396_02935 [Lutibacter sp. HS1-25]|uniref:hypothetical protein n=1 Tax=Lutibacter sp. HS1-25 TaxID=2485000 RepID=UPI001011C39C|nr:hypothetical protein [Lutibacter sp. HS1-25]RXP62689.1 hypothetical protein EC396_02935 [Lutibacter sp. HS1-25]
MRFLNFFLIAFGLFFTNVFYGQSVQDLQKKYSGKFNWEASKGILKFDTSGEINFEEKGTKYFIWDVPSEVKEIIIAKNTTVNGGFHTQDDCIISGENRKTSVVYGTEIQSWPQKNNIKAATISSFEAHNGTLIIQNITSLNPRSFHVRGLSAVVHLKDADFIDTRGGSGNHSDGIAAGDGSTVDNCYFETGDDVIKVYNDITVTNTTINMVQNAVPIQLGWGDYPDGAVGTFKNLTIIGNSGRGNPNGSNAIIVGRSGKYTVTINIDGLTIDNPSASIINLFDDKNDGIFEKTLKGTLKNVEVKNIKRYSVQQNGIDELELFDTTGSKISKDF